MTEPLRIRAQLLGQYGYLNIVIGVGDTRERPEELAAGEFVRVLRIAALDPTWANPQVIQSALFRGESKAQVRHNWEKGAEAIAKVLKEQYEAMFWKTPLLFHDDRREDAVMVPVEELHTILVRH